MIKYNTKTINDWNFDSSNIVKVYHNGAVCYYKLEGSPTPTGQTPCYAVVDDITQYSSTEFVDVFDKATKKWYKLNNLNQYERYGVYGEGRDITHYEGKLTVDNGYEYEYSNGDWVNRGEVSGTTATLPNVPFTVNYNAKNYDASTKTFAKTEGQLANTDVTVSGTLTAHDGYVTVSSGSRGVISGYDDYFNRTNSTPNLTITSKQRTEGQNCHMFANRSSNYNWMYRPYSSRLTLHGNLEYDSLAVTTQPVIESVRVYTDRSVTYNNYTDNTSNTVSDFNYGSSNGSVALFAGYTNNDTEWFSGDFYWIYMSQNTLTDEQVQEVINYNEGVSSIEYPIYYAERQDPPIELTFDTMEEALAYQCPYVGVVAIIGGTLYVFNSGYEWERLAFNITGVTTSNNVFDIQLNLQKVSVVIYKDNGDGTYNWGLYYPNAITDATNMCSGNTAMTSFDWGTSDTSSLTSLSSSFRDCSGLTSMPSIPSNVTEIGAHTFYNCSNMNNGGTIEIPEGVQRIGNQAFNKVFHYNSKNLKLPSTLNYVGGDAFLNKANLQNLYINDLSSFCKINFYNSNSAVFNESSTKLYVNNSQVTDLTIPSDITELKTYTFFSAATITSVTIPLTVTSIRGNGTFQYSGLRNVTVPSSVDSWNGNFTFAFCPNLTDATLNNKSQIGSFAFSNCTRLTGVTFGDNITAINNNAFRDCTSLTGVTFGDNMKSIANNAFNGCTKLASMTFNSPTPPTITSNSLQGIPSTCKFYVPCSALNAYRTASVWSSYASQIVGFESCTIYDWEVVPNEYICYNNDKYEKTKKICSFDGGTTWEDVTPIEYQRGQLIEASSTDCAIYATVDLNSQWQTSTSYGSISDTGNYDFYESFSNKGVHNSKATMFITINGYTSFTFKVRNSSESYWDYVVVNNLDDRSIPTWQPSVGSGTASSGKVYYSNQSISSNADWHDVTFSNLDGGEHYITVTYGKDGSGSKDDDRGYVAIPKTQ